MQIRSETFVHNILDLCFFEHVHQRSFFVSIICSWSYQYFLTALRVQCRPLDFQARTGTSKQRVFLATSHVIQYKEFKQASHCIISSMRPSSVLSFSLEYRNEFSDISVDLNAPCMKFC